QSVFLGDVEQTRERMLVIAIRLQHLLVERRCLRIEAFVEEVIGDEGELRDRAVAVAGTEVQIAKRVDRVPVVGLILDQPHVLFDRSGDLALPEQLLRLLQGRVTVDWHGYPRQDAAAFSPSYQT